MSAILAKSHHRPEPRERPPLDAVGLQLRQEIERCGETLARAIKSGDKAAVREFHLLAKAASEVHEPATAVRLLERYRRYFKPAKLIDPAKISPHLMLVEPRSRWEDLFRLGRAYWSMPYSKGYGRRLRYVLFDEYHESVIGLVGLQSPAADLACRDDLFSFPTDRKLQLVNGMMDAYTVGALPPYSAILGGKLVAGFVASSTIQRDYWKQYGSRKTIMEKRRLQQPLLAVTTTSAFGRSSIYNRLNYSGRTLFEAIGYTKGYGTLHLEVLYPRIREWLKSRGEYTSGGFGHGPKVRWQNIQNALLALGLKGKLLEHGLKREVFLIRHVSNLVEAVNTGATPVSCSIDGAAFSEFWKERWALPRAESQTGWRDIDSVETLRSGITAASSKT
jgi:Domain of unknown function (DUF4338)